MSIIDRIRGRGVDEYRHPDCCEQYSCSRPQHRPCDTCAELTCRRTLVLDENLRRTYVHRCATCRRERSFRPDRVQEKRAKERTKIDWELSTEPMVESSIDTTQFPDQYHSKVRDALKWFSACGADVAVVPGVDPATIRGSLAVLGLSDEFYAEKRDGVSVIRRIKDAA